MSEKMKYEEGLVSCVTPVYNGSGWMHNLLDSLLEQTYPRVEVIVSDDGSTDDTLAVAESYRDKFEKKGYIYKIVSGPHINASSAVSRGLKEVTGQYLIWPDSDDYLKRLSIEKRVNYLSSRPEADAVRSLAWYFEDSVDNRVKADEKRGDIHNTSLFLPVLRSLTFVCCGCYMLRSDLFFEIYPDRNIPIYDVGQNFQMLLPYLYKHKCYTIEEELYGVCVHADSHSRRTLSKDQEIKKYRDYEHLLDDVIKKANITDKATLRQIKLWKLKRRSALAFKYDLKLMRYSSKLQRIIIGDYYDDEKVNSKVNS